MNPKFKLGQTVRIKGDGEVGEIVSYVASITGISYYSISSKEVDLTEKKILEGVKHVQEDEIEAVKETKKADKEESDE
jgi:hypothetical protein